MYNEQLEQLIDAALADGVLTEKEKQVLFKKAQTFGIDLDEFEMVLDAKLVKMQKAQQAAPKSNKLGDVKKCPACGSIRIPGAKNCADCGYEFMSPLQELINDLNEAQKLANLEISRKTQSKQAEGDFISNFKSKLNKKGILGAAVETLLGSGMWDGEGDEESESYELIQRYQAPIIEGFPIPSDPDDLLEAMEYFNSEIEGADDYGPWERKQKQMIASAKRVFANDRSILKQINSYEENI
jgi:hypothetical protein